MIASYGFISLILSCFISIVHPQSSNVNSSAEYSSKLGPCACGLFGIFSECPDNTTFCDQLPHECSAYFWLEIRVALSYNIFDIRTPENDEYFKEILLCTKIPVIIGYGYESIKDWSIVLGCCGNNGKNVRDEVEALMVFRKEYPNISGLALMNFDYPSTMYFENITENINCYVNTLKELMPDLDIGMYMFANYLQSKYKDPEVKWINFEKLTKNVNFFVVTFNYLDIECTPELKDGINPVTGNHGFTLEKFTKILDALGVPAKKTSFRFNLGPDSPPSILKLGYPKMCEVRIKEMCLNPKNSTDFCSDTTATYYEKGAFAKNYGAGFIAWPVDKDDIKLDCHCGRPFPSFRAIVDGYEGAPCPPSCALLDRN